MHDIVLLGNGDGNQKLYKKQLIIYFQKLTCVIEKNNYKQINHSFEGKNYIFRIVKSYSTIF